MFSVIIGLNHKQKLKKKKKKDVGGTSLITLCNEAHWYNVAHSNTEWEVYAIFFHIGNYELC